MKTVKYKNYTGAIEATKDGQIASPTKPLLRELAKELNVDIENKNGDTALTTDSNKIPQNEITFIEFDTFEEAKEYAKKHIWVIIKRSDFGEGYVVVDSENKVNIINNAFLKALREEDLDEIIYYLNEGANPNIKMEEYDIPIVFASRHNNTKLIEVLIEAGADVNAKTESGRTALLFAVWDGNFQLIQYLMKKGADINVKTKEGSTALVTPICNNNIEMVEFLLKSGIDPDIASEEKETALIRAARYGHHEIVKLLLDAGADVNIETFSKKNILILLAYKAGREIIEACLDAGANVNAIDEYGNTPLLVSVKGGCLEGIQALLDAGAIVDVKPNNKGLTPLSVAKKKGFVDTLEMYQQNITLLNALEKDKVEVTIFDEEIKPRSTKNIAPKKSPTPIKLKKRTYGPKSKRVLSSKVEKIKELKKPIKRKKGILGTVRESLKNFSNTMTLIDKELQQIAEENKEENINELVKDYGLTREQAEELLNK